MESAERENLRKSLANAWRAVGNRLLDEGYSPADVTATMLSVSIASWSGLRDSKEAAEYLRAIADRIERTRGNITPDDVAA